MKRLASIIATVALVFTATTTTARADFPNKPITMLIGYKAGGTMTTQGRVLAAILEDILGQPVNVVNRPGAGGTVAATQLAVSKPDGYTLMFGSSTAVAFNTIKLKLNYKHDDLFYVATVSGGQPAFVTGGKSPFNDWKSFIAYAKANPGLSYATQGNIEKVIISSIARKEGLDIKLVPTKGGAGVIPLLMGGDVALGFSNGIHVRYTDSGDIKLIVALSDERLSAYPDVPSIREFGYDVSATNLRIVALPKGVPDNVKTKYADAIAKAVKHPDFVSVTKEKLKFPIIYKTSEQTTKKIASMHDEFKSTIKRLEK